MKKSITIFLIITVTILTADMIDFTLIKSKTADFKEYYRIFADQNSHLESGELAYLELAKIEVLNRNYELAIEYLDNINLPRIIEKHYWLAKSYLEAGKYHHCIISAQNYITGASDVNKIEIAYFFIAEAYIKQEMYKRSLKTLETLHNSKYINNNIALLHFKIGYCSEMIGKYNSALNSYKKIKQEFPYTQMSYKAEDRIKTIIREKDIDIPEKVREKPSPSKAETGEGLKIFLQVGAFSTKKNAQNKVKQISEYGYKTNIFPKIKNGKKLFIVAVGPFQDDNSLKRVSSNLKKNNISFFVLKRY